MQRGQIVGNRYWIAVVFFLFAAAPGCWLPVLSSVLRAKGWDETQIMWAFIIPPLVGILSPLAFAAKADRKYPAEKILALILAGGSVLLFAAFWSLEYVNSPTLFLVIFGLNTFISAPAWSLLTSVTLSNLDDTARQFGSFRVWGTIGWVVASLVVSWMHIDQSTATGMMAAGIRVVAGFTCLLLPHTPPRGGKATNWRSALGLDSLRILRDRNLAVYLATSFLFTIPLSAFYLHSPLYLEDMGIKRVAAWMSLGQVSEVVAFMLLGYVLVRWRLKLLLLLAIGFGVLRYGLYAAGGAMDSTVLILVGVSMHGYCWTFFFESGRVFLDRRVDPGMRAQTQALITLASGGVGAVLGTITVGWLYRMLVVGEGAPGWSTYWWVLTGMCVVIGIIFSLGYQEGQAGMGEPIQPGRGNESTG